MASKPPEPRSPLAVYPSDRAASGISQPAKGSMIALAIAGACAVCLPLTTSSEGEKVKPYWDPAHIRTVCFGETQGIEERIYERSECASMLRRRLGRDYAPAILKCVPAFIEPRRRQAFAASIDASYNAGPGAFCRSPMAAAFNAGRWASGCAAFPSWYITSKVRVRVIINHKPVVVVRSTVLPGLVTRRRNEMAMCLKEVA